MLTREDIGLVKPKKTSIILVTFEEKGMLVHKTVAQLIEDKFLEKKLKLDKILVSALMLSNDQNPIKAFKEYVELATAFGFDKLTQEQGMPEDKAYIIYTACLLHFHMELILDSRCEAYIDELMDLLVEHIE